MWGGEGAGLGTVDCGVVTLNVFVNNSLGFLPLLCIGVFGGGRARLGQQTSSLAGGGRLVQAEIFCLYSFI